MSAAVPRRHPGVPEQGRHPVDERVENYQAHEIGQPEHHRAHQVGAGEHHADAALAWGRRRLLVHDERCCVRWRLRRCDAVRSGCAPRDNFRQPCSAPTPARGGTAVTPEAAAQSPPNMKTLRQPNCGMIQAARKPPNAAAVWKKPQNMPLVSVARRPSGQYSLIKVTALGIAAPSPRPVTKRHITSWVRLPENAEARQATPKMSTEPIRNALRPRRSASRPAERAPKAKPNSAALRTGPQR